ncbi:MAG: hypothetical protein COB84_10080 [Rhodobacteraceae bacterium]|nr:MAG: hypothetical protein COB84_10080 [Paracoccaceae bacterium]
MEKIIKEPKQARSVKSFEKVVQAGTVLLSDGKHQGFSILAISQLSGVSVGSIYQRFESKEKLYLVIQNEILNRLDKEATQQFSKDLRYDTEVAAVHDTVQRFAKHVATHEVLLGGMIARGMIDPQANMRGHLSCLYIGNAFKAHLKQHIKSPTHPDPELAFDMSFRIVFSCLWRWITEQDTPESSRYLEFDAMVQELCVVCERYLLS